jgi:fermentation-respiration switch protein FrsA (DUF1100 family)
MSGQPVGAGRPNPPLLVMQGDSDTINPPDLSQAVYDRAQGPRYLVTLVGGGHLPPFAGGTKWQSTVEAVTTDFLNLYVAATTADDAQMRADANHPGVTILR